MSKRSARAFGARTSRFATGSSGRAASFQNSTSSSMQRPRYSSTGLPVINQPPSPRNKSGPGRIKEFRSLVEKTQSQRRKIVFCCGGRNHRSLAAGALPQRMWGHSAGGLGSHAGADSRRCGAGQTWEAGGQRGSVFLVMSISEEVRSLRIGAAIWRNVARSRAPQRSRAASTT